MTPVLLTSLTPGLTAPTFRARPSIFSVIRLKNEERLRKLWQGSRRRDPGRPGRLTLRVGRCHAAEATARSRKAQTAPLLRPLWLAAAGTL